MVCQSRRTNAAPNCVATTTTASTRSKHATKVKFSKTRCWYVPRCSTNESAPSASTKSATNRRRRAHACCTNCNASFSPTAEYLNVTLACTKHTRNGTAKNARCCGTASNASTSAMSSPQTFSTNISSRKCRTSSKYSHTADRTGTRGARRKRRPKPLLPTDSSTQIVARKPMHVRRLPLMV